VVHYFDEQNESFDLPMMLPAKDPYIMKMFMQTMCMKFLRTYQSASVH
jgi:hypothetical protein